MYWTCAMAYPVFSNFFEACPCHSQLCCLTGIMKKNLAMLSQVSIFLLLPNNHIEGYLHHSTCDFDNVLLETLKDYFQYYDDSEGDQHKKFFW